MSGAQKSSGDGYADKARDLAGKNPDKARGAIDKAADFLNSKTGGKFESAIDKGKGAVGDTLGLPDQRRDKGTGGKGTGSSDKGSDEKRD